MISTGLSSSNALWVLGHIQVSDEWINIKVLWIVQCIWEINVMKIIPWSVLTIRWKEQDPGKRLTTCCCLMTWFVLWPLAFKLPSHVHWLFCPSLSSKHGGWTPRLKPHAATGLYLQTLDFDRSPPAMEILGTILRLIWYFKTKLKIQTSCYGHSVSMLTPSPHFLLC